MPSNGDSSDSMQGPATPARPEPGLSLGKAIVYSLPALGAGYMNPTVGGLAMKFATDALLIAPAVMGLIFSVSRIWDAISDPLIGYGSDRTRSRLGRRRIWILASALPLGLSFWMIFAPPVTWEGGWLIAWVAAGIIGYFTFLGMFMIPHYSLGAELAASYHDKSRLFAFRHAFWASGTVISVAGFQLAVRAQAAGPQVMREVMATTAAVVATITAGLIVYAVLRLPEPTRHQPLRAVRSPLGTVIDVATNPHARLLLVVYFIENLGFGAVAALTLYVAQYVIGYPQYSALMVLLYALPSVLFAPAWLPLSRRIGKARLWTTFMVVTALSLGSTSVLPFIPPTIGLWLLLAVMALAGMSASCAAVMAPSIMGDAADYDEHRAGEGKHGSYYAALLFVQKSAYGIVLLATGLVLQFSGFEPNQEQPLTVKVAIIALFGFTPLVCYSIGAFMFTRYRLDEREHREIRRQLDARRTPASAAG